MRRTNYLFAIKHSFFILIMILCTLAAQGSHQPEFSTAGFHTLKGSGRNVYSMNVAWRFHKGAAPGAEMPGFDDKAWTAVSLPHGIEYLPAEASGCINYQGEIWYRKHFTPNDSLKGKKLFLHFEAIMGKSKIYINGQLTTEHYGGFLPVIADISQYIKWGENNVIAVWADNSNDPLYPPGKDQNVLDFAYFGGIYRDCWLVTHNPVHITDPNYENEVAGGGLLTAFGKISEKEAEILLKLHVRNEHEKSFSGTIQYELIQTDGKTVAVNTQRVSIKAGQAASFNSKLMVNAPELWSPDRPYLYALNVQLRDNKNQIIDGYRKRIGVRSIEFKGSEGFWLNGKPYGQPLIGANRHQDFAVIGNALSNSLHWRDAKKLRDAGLRVIRNAHYPQDPAFMDACDELGLFVIVNTPGWQFWNKEPIFQERVYSDIRNMVRRDRNHASVWLWEPILNETWYPDYFAQRTKEIVHEEFPYANCYAACDAEARGNEHFSILFAHPENGSPGWEAKHIDPAKTYFTREWGDNVDDWNSHNSTSRVHKSWGEQAMLIQSQHYAKPTYAATCYDSFYHTTAQHAGGCLWHSFDHQRGYHPDPFYGGIMDAFRQPKTSYHMFKTQRPASKSEMIAENGPMIYIANEMTPFSGADVTIYSNCDEIRLTVFENGKQHIWKKDAPNKGMPAPAITFRNAYDFMADKALSRKGKQAQVYLLAEGLIDGKVVATHQRFPARRPAKILLWADNEGVKLHADGSDLVTIVAAIADQNGNIKRLNESSIRFSVEGEGRLIGDETILANPAPVVWGTAPVLLQSTTKAGKIKIHAEMLFPGDQVPLSAELELESFPATTPLVYTQEEAERLSQATTSAKQTINNEETTKLKREIELLKKELSERKLKEVEKSQEEFGE